MKATTTTTEKSGQARRTLLQTVNFLITFALGILTGIGKFSGGFYPLGAAWCAAVPGRLVLPAAAGCVIGALSAVPFGRISCYVVAILVAAGLRIAVEKLVPETARTVLSAACGVAGLLAGGVLSSLLARQGAAGWILIGCEAAVGGSCAALFHTAVSTLSRPRASGMPGEAQRVSLMVSLSLMLAVGVRFTVLGIAPARVLAVLIILCMARYAGAAGGVVAGAAMGAAMTLMGEPEGAWIAGGYALGGLLAGLFSRFGGFGTAVALVLGNGLFVLSASGSEAAIITLIEVAAASVLFLAFPKSAKERLSLLLTPRAEPAKLRGLRHALVRRLQFSARSLGDVSSVVDQVSEKLEDIDRRDLGQVFERCETTVCRSCALRLFCYSAAREDTRLSFQSAAAALRQGKETPEQVLPASFRNRCVKPSEVTECLKDGVREFVLYENAGRRAREIRGAVSDQLGAVSLLLMDLSEEFDRAQRYDREAELQVRDVLRGVGILAADVGCPVDSSGRMRVEIIARQIAGGVLSRSGLVTALSGTLHRDFDFPCVSRAGEDTLIRVSERAAYRLTTGIASRACRGHTLCGDASAAFSDGNGREILLLSDGMGNGARAAVDSAMVTGLMHRLLGAGFGYDCALTIVNSAMLFKSEDETLATVDLTSFDCYTGKCAFYKAGAPATLVVHGGKLARADCASFPAGILREVRFDRSECELSDGDLIVMISDGLTYDGDEWIGKELLRVPQDTPQQIADRLVQLAARNRNDGHGDDLTCVVAQVEKMP